MLFNELDTLERELEVRLDEFVGDRVETRDVTELELKEVVEVF